MGGGAVGQWRIIGVRVGYVSVSTAARWTKPTSSLVCDLLPRTEAARCLIDSTVSPRWSFPDASVHAHDLQPCCRSMGWIRSSARWRSARQRKGYRHGTDVRAWCSSRAASSTSRPRRQTRKPASWCRRWRPDWRVDQRVDRRQTFSALLISVELMLLPARPPMRCCVCGGASGGFWSGAGNECIGRGRGRARKRGMRHEPSGGPPLTRDASHHTGHAGASARHAVDDVHRADDPCCLHIQKASAQRTHGSVAPTPILRHIVTDDAHPNAPRTTFTSPRPLRSR